MEVSAVPNAPRASWSVTQRLRTSLRRFPKAPHVPNFVWCALFTAIGGFVFGFDTGSIGSVTTMPQFISHFSSTRALSTTIQGLIVSTILVTASMASLVSGPLSDRISRTRTISLGAFIFAAGSAISCASRSLAMLFVGRCVAGIGEGLFLSTVTVYAIEIAPASARGRLGSMVQLLCTMGIASGYFICYGTVQIPSSLSWRFPFGLQAVISAILAVGSPFLPHSPRWLRHVGRAIDADAAWVKLDVVSADAQKTEENASRDAVQRLSWWQEAQQLWKRGVKARTALGVFLMGMQQASGIDGVLYYAPVLFAQAGLSASAASFAASGVSGLINVVFTLIVQFFADDWGRRPSMICGGTVIGVSMMLIGSLYASQASDTQAGRWAIIVLIYIFVVGFAASWAIVTRIICSEIQPMRTRAAATSLGQCANWVVNWIIAFTTPMFLARTSSGPYFLFGTCSLLTTLVCLAFQPETRGASLEEVDKAFEIAPWRAALGRRRERSRSDPGAAEEYELALRSRPQVIIPGHEINDDVEEIDTIRLPEVKFGGPWHWAR
ncbi:general substrate transporter [Fomitopsis serialis]|uniref:general substrate transporter n=1 Tax=Fomitopsis serialis TaxID=139415 RepID=UPI0020073BB8|nr:general substrate transporter [Neoantrodia serialis]KAH9937434.1 general substrate transporter [Neoantrodia serialis]